MLAHIEFIKKVGRYMKNKQKIIYIDDRWTDTINEDYLKNDWRIISLYPVVTKIGFGAYVLLEKNNTVESALNNIGISMVKSTNEILYEIAEKWNELGKEEAKLEFDT